MSEGSEPAKLHFGLAGRMASVGGLTLLSRIAGFLRDLVFAAVLGAGPVADAFFVALRLPNHFRAIFAEGAFNAAFVPSFARAYERQGASEAGVFADRVFTILLGTQIVLLAIALAFTPAVVGVLAPGLRDDPQRYELAVELTRITFPYLLLMTLVTLFGGMLNSINRFAAAAAAPVLLNLTLMAALALAAFFPTPGHAAAWGVLVAGVLELWLVAGDAYRRGFKMRLRWPRWDKTVRDFFVALAPATVGSAGLQLALFADTIIASFLATGALSALYYADRLNQLPIGIVGIAAGTVLLPEMARRIAAGEEDRALAAQNRAIELTLVLSLPFIVAFLVLPELIMRALFVRGAFTAADAAAAAATLRAYALGLLPFVLIRSLVATFFARGDTATPVKASLLAAGINIGCKIILVQPLAQVGLALATSIGAWVNVGLVTWLAMRSKLFAVDRRLSRASAKLTIVGVILAVSLWAGEHALAATGVGRHEFPALLILALFGAVLYAALLAIIYRTEWRGLFGGLRSR